MTRRAGHTERSIRHVDAGDAVLQASRMQHRREKRQRRFVAFVAIIVNIALVAVIGIASMKSIERRNAMRNISVGQAYAELQQVRVKPRFADDKGGILLSNSGYGRRAPGAPTIEIYTDPMCPGCAVLHQQMDTVFRSLLDAGQINLSIHPVTFLDHMSSDGYSTRAGNAIAYISSEDSNPDHLIDFMSNLYSSEFQPREGSQYNPVSDDAIKQQMTKAGIDPVMAGKAMTGGYGPWLEASTRYTQRRKDLADKTGQFAGKITTPTIVINNSKLNINTMSDEGFTYEEAIMQSLGLNSDAIGQSGSMPSIGANGKPGVAGMTA